MITLPMDTPIPKLPSKRRVLRLRRVYLTSHGLSVLEVAEKWRAYIDPIKVVVAARLGFMWRTRKMDMLDGHIDSMQLLGDATIWKACLRR